MINKAMKDYISEKWNHSTSKVVEFKHLDGTYMKLYNAKFKIFNNKFVIVTEHNGEIINFVEDAEYIRYI